MYTSGVLAIKKNEVALFTRKWMNLEIINAAEQLLCAGETTGTRERPPPQDADLSRREVVRLHQLGGSTQTAKAGEGVLEARRS